MLDDLADGNVTIAGREYPVNQAVVDALTDWPDFYNAGVIGPDGLATSTDEETDKKIGWIRAGAGAPIKPSVRGTLDQRIGADFSGVRVHEGSAAHEAMR